MEYDELEDEPIISPDTDNATHFNHQEAPPEHQAKFKRLNGYNTGVYNGYWTDQEEVRRLDNLAIFDAISSHLELTTYQKRSGRQLFDSLDLKPIGNSATLVALCVCAFVCRQDGRMYHPYRKDENNDSLFRGFVKSLSENQDTIAACYGRVSDSLE